MTCHGSANGIVSLRSAKLLSSHMYNMYNYVNGHGTYRGNRTPDHLGDEPRPESFSNKITRLTEAGQLVLLFVSGPLRLGPKAGTRLLARQTALHFIYDRRNETTTPLY